MAVHCCGCVTDFIEVKWRDITNVLERLPLIRALYFRFVSVKSM